MLPNFILFLILGSLVSAIGFATNSAPAVMGSMLISPLLSPLFNLAETSQNVKFSDVYNTAMYIAIGIAICTSIGYLVARVVKPAESEEMISRLGYKRTTKHLIMNAMIPALCGIILVFAKADGNILAMTGVGLSIAVLPPLVNSGMYLEKGEHTKAWSSFEYALVNIVVITTFYFLTLNFVPLSIRSGN